MNTARINGLFAAAILAGAAAILLSAYTFRRMGDNEKIHASRIETLRELAALRDHSANDRAAVSLYESLGTNAAPDLETAVRKIVPDAKPAVESLHSEPLSGGWSLRQSVVNFDDVAFSDAGRCVEFLENQRPPWRLTRCEFSAKAPGRGRARLTLESIAR